jgi:glycosyltransferase involved in cell wall biosynthesis
LPDAGVLIAHPTRQHSNRLAQALHAEGWLQGYWTLLPDERTLDWIPPFARERFPSAIRRNSLQELPRNKVHLLPGPLIAQKLASRFSNQGTRLLGEYIAWSAIDRWVASQLPKQMPRIVVGYEMCCAETFRVARSLGIKCLLDAAAVHFGFQDNASLDSRNSQLTWAGRQLRTRKATEIVLADQIICVSEFARRTYLDAGVNSDKISVNPVGCDSQLFSQASTMQRSGPVKFIFAGVPAIHKGSDLLFSCFERIIPQANGVELHIAGDSLRAKKIINQQLKGLELHGKLSHAKLVELLSFMDCLVLPSRLESFGMVVVEALAAGVPVIVSDHVGAAEAVREGINGWIIPADDSEALYQRMLACCENIDKVRTMRATCTESSRDYDWSHYSRRAVEIFSRLLVLD